MKQFKNNLKEIENSDLFLFELEGQKASKYVDSIRRFCKERVNPESFVFNNKNLRLLKTEKFMELLNMIKNNKLKNEFSCNDILEYFNLIGWTTGTKIRSYLALLNCYGEITKKLIEYKDKKGKNKIKYIFTMEKQKPCEYLSYNKNKNKLCCSYNFDKGTKIK